MATRNHENNMQKWLKTPQNKKNLILVIRHQMESYELARVAENYLKDSHRIDLDLLKLSENEKKRIWLDIE